MTSFSRKLYLHCPAAAEDFHRVQQFEHRLVHGKHVTLAQFVPAKNLGATQPFGKRLQPPVLPAYECWMPDPIIGSSVILKPKAIVRAQSSFQARQEYARHHGIETTDVVARLLPTNNRRFQ